MGSRLEVKNTALSHKWGLFRPLLYDRINYIKRPARLEVNVLLQVGTIQTKRTTLREVISSVFGQ